MDGVIGRGTVLSGRYELTDPRPCDLPGTTEWRATDQILGRPVVVRAFNIVMALLLLASLYPVLAEP